MPWPSGDSASISNPRIDAVMSGPLFPPAAGVRGVVFDLDGTLVDSYAAIAASVNAVREAFGLDPLAEREIRLRVGRGLEALMADVVGPEHAETGVRLFREHYAGVYAEATSVLPGALHTIRELGSRGYRMAVASNKLARFGRPILEHLGMAEFFRAIEGPDTAGATKPDPSMIDRCLRAMGVAKEEAVYVGDMVMDVETASRAGVSVVLVPGGSSDREDLLCTGAPVLGSLVDLLGVLPPLGEARRQDEIPA
jgi:2-phosphoglycolate phosphatase